jgi:hypothetical protein
VPKPSRLPKRWFGGQTSGSDEAIVSEGQTYLPASANQWLEGRHESERLQPGAPAERVDNRPHRERSAGPECPGRSRGRRRPDHGCVASSPCRSCPPRISIVNTSCLTPS